MRSRVQAGASPIATCVCRAMTRIHGCVTALRTTPTVRPWETLKLQKPSSDSILVWLRRLVCSWVPPVELCVKECEEVRCVATIGWPWETSKLATAASDPDTLALASQTATRALHWKAPVGEVETSEGCLQSFDPAKLVEVLLLPRSSVAVAPHSPPTVLLSLRPSQCLQGFWCFLQCPGTH